MNLKLEVFSDLSERLKYNLPDFPLYVKKGTLHNFDGYRAMCHWHSDLEFLLVLEGSIEYFINGQTVIINEGNGIFINSKRLHYGFSSSKTDCTYIVVAIHPVLIGEKTQIGNTYIENKFGSSTSDYILLDIQNPWQKEVLILLNQIYNEMHIDKPNPIRLLYQAAFICASVGDNLHPTSNYLADDKSWVAIWKMTEFIHGHYSLNIKLRDIAAYGAVCRSRCCELFSKYIGQTPNNYLKDYRISKSCEMLKETNRSISEIALACGFQTASYFSYVFKKEMGIIPQDYRKETLTSLSE